MRAALSFILCLCTSALIAAPLPSAVRTEVLALMAQLGASGCQFMRNGSWYSGTEAKTHLLRKLDYLEGKDQVHSTEQFIALAASTSSSSGKPYQVRCDKAETVNSAVWLQQALEKLRSSNTAVPKK